MALVSPYVLKPGSLNENTFFSRSIIPFQIDRLSRTVKKVTILALDASSDRTPKWKRLGAGSSRSGVPWYLNVWFMPRSLNSARQDKGARKRDTCCLLCHCPMIYARPIIVPRFLATLLSPLLVLVELRNHETITAKDEEKVGEGVGRGLWVKSPRESKPLVEWLWL